MIGIGIVCDQLVLICYLQQTKKFHFNFECMFNCLIVSFWSPVGIDNGMSMIVVVTFTMTLVSCVIWYH